MIIKKVLLIQRILSVYNIPLYAEIQRYYDFYVGYTEKNEDIHQELKNTFQIEYLTTREWEASSEDEKKEFLYRLSKVVDEYDAVILPMEPVKGILDVIEYLRNRLPVLLWGIGVAAGYETEFDSVEYNRPSFQSMIAMADASIFYSDYPIHKYIKNCIPECKMFVANNTVKVKKITLNPKREHILVIGTFLFSKQLDRLINCYKKAFDCNDSLPPLIFVGDGEARTDLEKLVKEIGLDEKVSFYGAIYDEEKLAEIFGNAIATISTRQAGLSVLKSMGYGVAYITQKNAITGGERLNIIDRKTGRLFSDDEELFEIMLDIAERPSDYVNMGENAYSFYYENRTVEMCAKGFIEALEYCESNRRI